MFTQALAKHAQALGVRFMFNTSIDRIVTDGARVSGVVTSAGTLQADSYVLALGSWSSRLAAPLGIGMKRAIGHTDRPSDNLFTAVRTALAQCAAENSQLPTIDKLCGMVINSADSAHRALRLESQQRFST